MALQAEREAIVKRIMAKWNQELDGPFFMDNFQGPVAPSGQFTEVNILTGESVQRNVGGHGNTCIRTHSMVQFTIYSPQNIGVDNLDRTCDRVRRIFLHYSVKIDENGGKLVFKVPTFFNRGKGSGRFTRVASCPFYRDEFV